MSHSDYMANVALIDELNRIYELFDDSGLKTKAVLALGKLLDELDPTDEPVAVEAGCKICGSTDGFHTEDACFK